MPVTVPHHTYPPAGKCIYCNEAPIVLREEHIIPHGIGGRLVLPKASCLVCQGITTRFDSKVQNNMMSDFRTRMGFVNRRGKLRRGRIRIETQDEGGFRTQTIPAAEWPRFLMMPQFPPPHLLSGRTDIESRMWASVHKEDARAIGRKYGAGRGRELRWHMPTFCRMLAKIAHSFAYAEIGEAELKRFLLMLPPIIRNEIKAMPADLIGGDVRLVPPTENLHELNLWSAIADDIEYLVARIRLFAAMGTPTYYAIVGVRPFTGKALAEEPVRLR